MNFASTIVAAENRIRWKVIVVKVFGIPTPLPGYETKQMVASVKAIAEP